MYGETVVTVSPCQKWFVKFYAADASLDDAPQSGRPVEVDSDQIETLIENNQQSTLYHPEDRWHTQNIQIECWKSFALTWLITLMFGFHISEKKPSWPYLHMQFSTET